MHAESHHSRKLFAAILLALLALMLLARPAHSAWNADPVQVHATTALCPLVAACDDAHYGAIFTWQENSGPGGVLKAQHLTANGDVDPAWGAPVAVCSANVTRSALGSVTDGTGGAYVWWVENTVVWITRLAPEGVIAPGWPARGRNLGTMYSSRLRPAVAGDGSGGLYIAWLAGTLTDPFAASVRAIHLGPANTGKGGWPNSARVLGTTPDATELVNSLGIDAAPDGGLWLAFATTTIEAPQFGPGDVRVAHYTAAGAPAAGWDSHGVSLAPFRGDVLVNTSAWNFVPGMNLVAVASDGASGAYVVHGDVGVEGTPDYRLSRVAGDGAAAQGWAPEGLALSAWGYAPTSDYGSTSSVRALADGRGGVFAGLPGFGSEFTYVVQFQHFSGGGSAAAGGLGTDRLGMEYASRGDGGMFVASFQPTGPTSSYSPNAYLQALQSDPGSGFGEFHDTPVITWYGDVALTATGDGGAIFGWTQVNERFGVYAVRLSPAGLVTGVPPTHVPNGRASLRLRFVPGVGVRALLASVPSGPVELSLHDAAGRHVSSAIIESAASGDWVFPGTEALPSGLYFARAAIGALHLHARVVVVQ